jgi:hypothetical protein
MKKVLLTLMGAVLALGASAQTIVSTTPSTRNVVFEEFTGINCGYCPLGHQMVSEYAAAHPGQVVPINIHQGGYATAYTTQWGNAIANQTNLQGYPAGSISRQVSSCQINTVTASGSDWYTAANAIMAQTSPVNVAATAQVDAATRVMTITVEVYYTAAVSQSYNLLNVDLLQDNIIGTQHNYGNYNPTQITASGQYRHMHMLRDMITGQWGDSLSVGDTIIPAGTFITKTYTYNIPATISTTESGAAVPVELGNLTLAVFVTDGYSTACPSLHGPNIYTGVSCTPSYINVTPLAASLQEVTVAQKYGCNDLVTPSIKVRNNGANTITSMTINYSSTTTANQQYNFTGSISTFSDTTFALPDLAVTIGNAETITATIANVNGTDMTGLTGTATVTKPALVEGHGTPILLLKRDKYGSETSWKLYDANGTVINQGGPYTDVNAAPTKPDTIALSGITAAGCYTFEIFDKYGDGINSGYGSGYYKIYDAGLAHLMVNSNGKYGAGEKKDLKVVDMVGLEDANENIYQTLVYPNPATDNVTLAVSVNNSSAATINVVDMLGREVINLGSCNLRSGDNNFNINTTNLSNGVYYVRVITNNGITAKKLTINK